ncbi:histidine kinase [Halobiforma lacisalsi AJ5]|uniref:histidine kinase n=1 Tax=Natronobacterium lacisalsi AJ5 TaxID=358396 RepID=A0A1P8LUV8_NATLA|nr:ATP-binding protein [Halobiforma lacisalsi]APW99532.1 histidine kinase [Halobiforma lacisalsi AJ5]
MSFQKHLLEALGPRRIIAVLGGLYVVLAVGRGFVRFTRDVPPGNILVVTLLIAFPGFGLIYGSYWLSHTDIGSKFYSDIARWCLIGFGAMAIILLLYHLQPEGGISTPATSPPILTALSTVAGFGVGIHDAQAKTRTDQLEQRNRELEETQVELEETVDELEDANERLERYREYTDHVLDAIDDIFYVLDDAGSLRRWNESLCEVTGYSEAEISSMTAVDFFDDDEHPLIAETIADGFETGSIQLEAELLTKEGEPIPYEFVASTVENPDNESVLAGIGRDITERKEWERELENRVKQQEVVAEIGQLALERDDLDEVMAEAAQQVAAALHNEYCMVLDFDSSREELQLRQGVGWDDEGTVDVSISTDETDSQAAYTLANDHPVVVENFETETRFSGSELLTSHDIRSGISTLIGTTDDPWGLIAAYDTNPQTFTEEDVTFVQSVATILADAIERNQYQNDLEQLVADLEESNERLEQFAYAASHDLQEPLRMVSSYLQLIERRYGDELDEDGEEFLEFAVDGADRMRSMIDGLLQYSRVETQGSEFEPVDLENVLDDVREDLRMKIEESDAKITAESLPRVTGDEEQLRQVFQNLLSNAIKYSGEGPPKVHISAGRNGTDWTVSVSDNGIGIDPKDQDRIFEVFEGLHAADDYTGTGIGLAVCERIIERHGGEIWVESEPGEGSTFSVTLPAVTDRFEEYAVE